MQHRFLCIAGSPRRGGNTELLLDKAIEGAQSIGAEITKLVLNEMDFVPCQNCGVCSTEGRCRFEDDMVQVYDAIESCDRFIVAVPIYFTTVSAQAKAMIDRCQPYWARKFLLKRKRLEGDRRGIMLSVSGFPHGRFFSNARKVLDIWMLVTDIKPVGEFCYFGIDGKDDIEKHPTALEEVYAAGGMLA